MKKKVWLDITNTPQVHFLLGIKNGMDPELFDYLYSSRDFSNTPKFLAQRVDDEILTIGKHYGKKKAKKIYGLIERFLKLSMKVPTFDLSLSCGSESAILLSWLKGKKSVAFGDNDTAPQWTYSRWVDFNFFPDAIPFDILEKQGIRKDNTFMYPGYKEDIYIADFVPDSSFLATLPFNEYVLVRPENLQANYVKNENAYSIVPKVVEYLQKQGKNILYLPRYDVDYDYVKDIKNVYIPDKPISGLDAVYNAEAVLTGAGTFAREAACLGIPAVSFFAGTTLLAVDKKMISEGKFKHTRDADEVIAFLENQERKEADLTRSKEVKRIVMDKLNEKLREFSII
ncbi:MAG: hypothetical protein SCALA702_33650 [Melioribacteraceae bacterium]|nr:MAG: hypothetical protein SCALA702_33650 [Melioribacteraceae bacterium]